MIRVDPVNSFLLSDPPAECTFSGAGTTDDLNPQMENLLDAWGIVCMYRTMRVLKQNRADGKTRKESSSFFSGIPLTDEPADSRDYL